MFLCFALSFACSVKSADLFQFSFYVSIIYNIGTALPLVHGVFKDIWVYWVGPMFGGALASGIFRLTADSSEFDDDEFDDADKA